MFYKFFLGVFKVFTPPTTACYNNFCKTITDKLDDAYTVTTIIQTSDSSYA